MAGGLYLVVRRWRPAAASAVVTSGLATVVLLSLAAMSPWPRWAIDVPLLARVPWTACSPGVTSTDEVVRSDTQLDKGNELPMARDVDTSMTTVNFDGVASDAESPSPTLANAAGNIELDKSSKPPMPPSTPWSWQTITVGLLVAMIILGFGWFLLGLLAVRRERLRARLVRDRELLELVDVLCAELGCRRSVEVRQSSGLATAATIGWRRPTLLLPDDWPKWTADQRRAVLAHEIAHARSNDFLALLLGQIGLTLHFYHPLVHWLIGRLRLEQELAADAAAASVSGGQRHYLTTIAELALRQQDRPLLWPARSFLPTRTTFLRRIAMLRDSKLKVERLSPSARLVTIGVVLLCGLAVAGLRGPNGSPAALADEPEKATSAPNDVIDTTYMMEKASLMVVIRPPAMLAKPELAKLAKFLDGNGNVVPKGTHVTDFRQIMAFATDVASGPREVVVYQWAKPVAEAELTKLMAGKNSEIKDVDGKKMYVVSRDGNTRETLLLDEYTTVSGSEEAMNAYLSGKRGVLPPWLPAKAWESFRGDQIVMAGDTARMRKEIGEGMRHSPPLIQAAYASLSPLLDNATSLAAGARLDQGPLSVHAHATAKDATSVEPIQKTVEALKLLAQSALKGVRAAIEADQHPDNAAKLSLLDTGDGLLNNAKFDREGVEVRLSTSAKLDLAQLAASLSRMGSNTQLARARNNLKMIGLAMLNYEAAQRHFPPAVLYGPDGKTPYSWRVAVLPFLDRDDLYREYHFDEPWDGPNNRKLIEKMPEVFRCPSEPAESTNASYFVLAGPGTMFDGKEGTKVKQIVDGMANTLLIVEAKRDIPWTKPEDIPYDPAAPLPKLGGYFERGFNVVIADGSVRLLPSTIREKTLRLLITKADRQPVSIQDAMSAATGASDPGTKEGTKALVEDFFRHNYRDITARKTIEWGDYQKTPAGYYSIRYKYRATYWNTETKINNQVFTFSPAGKYLSVTDVKGYPTDTDDNPQAAKTPRRVYQVNKKVSDFPDREDLTTPEAAYASIHRAYVAEGDAAWKRLSAPDLAKIMPEGKKTPPSKAAAKRWLDAEVLEVHVWAGDHATVLAAEEGRIDLRSLLLVDGRWLNTGNDMSDSLEQARQKIERWSGRPAEGAGANSQSDGKTKTILKGHLAHEEGAPAANDVARTADKTPPSKNAIVEGVGWKDLKVGMTREELVKVMGEPDKEDRDPTGTVLRWPKKHIDCVFFAGATGVSEIRFNEGFKGALANGLRVGGPDNIVKLYGNAENVIERGNGARALGYTSKGIVLWAYEGHVAQIIVLKPCKLEQPTGEGKAKVTAASIDVAPEQLKKAEAGNFWAKYELWAAYHKGAGGVAKDPEKAKKWLAELIKGTYLATFEPVNGFSPKTPAEFLKKFNEHSKLRSEPTGLGGASFFRTRIKDGKLIGAFLTAYPDKMQEAIAANPSLKLLSIKEISLEGFVHYEASPQESLVPQGEVDVTDDIAENLKKAEGGDFWAKYKLWATYHKGEGGAAKDPEKAKKWLAELVKGTYLATFEPTGTFAPKDPGVFLANFGKHSNLRSEATGLGGASFFRTRIKDGKLIGSFLTAYPDKMRKAITDNPSLKLISIKEITPEEFIQHDASPQESLDTEEPPISEEARPKVISMTPANGATDVSPQLDAIVVKFDRAMRDGSWSMCGGGPHFPENAGTPSYDAKRTTWTVPVKLKPDWSYEFMLNSPSFTAFRSADGVPLAPVTVKFKTKK